MYTKTTITTSILHYAYIHRNTKTKFIILIEPLVVNSKMGEVKEEEGSLAGK